MKPIDIAPSLLNTREGAPEARETAKQPLDLVAALVLFAVVFPTLDSGSVAPYDLKPRQYILKVLPGKSVRGMFYTPQQWRMLPPSESVNAQSADTNFM